MLLDELKNPSCKRPKKVEQAGFKPFKTVSQTINIHNKKILKYFDNKNTNASAEPFYAKKRLS